MSCHLKSSSVGAIMAVIFISHSKRDKQLVQNIQAMLTNLGHTPIIEEFIPEERKEPIPKDEIRKNVQLSHALFLFLTDEIVQTKYTENWVIYEVGLASDRHIPIFIFEREGLPIHYPIPDVTDYMIFDPQSIEDILNIQKLAKEVGKLPPNLLTAGIGALLGIPFGPLGIAIGGIGGWLLGPKGGPPIPMLRLECPHCKATYNYWSLNIKYFHCPSCRKPIQIKETM